MEYKKEHSIRVRKGIIVQGYIVTEIDKHINLRQNKKKINSSSIDFNILMLLKEDVLFNDMKFENNKLKKAEVDIVILKNNKIYLVETKAGRSHNDHRKCESIKEVLEDAKKYLIKEYNFNSKNIIKILLISEGYTFNAIPEDMEILKLQEFEKLLNLPKNFASNINKKIKKFDTIHGIV